MSFVSSTEGETIEMGGLNDPEKGALVYERRTKVKTVPTGTGRQKRVKEVVEETKWLKPAARKGSHPKAEEIDEYSRPQPQETNPLYSTTEYVSDFHNPLYSTPKAKARREAQREKERERQTDRQTDRER